MTKKNTDKEQLQKDYFRAYSRNRRGGDRRSKFLASVDWDDRKHVLTNLERQIISRYYRLDEFHDPDEKILNFPSLEKVARQLKLSRQTCHGHKEKALIKLSPPS